MLNYFYNKGLIAFLTRCKWWQYLLMLLEIVVFVVFLIDFAILACRLLQRAKKNEVINLWGDGSRANNRDAMYGGKVPFNKNEIPSSVVEAEVVEK